MITFSGCAGWSLPKSYAEHFPVAGTHLERYAARFNAVEINSSFYRPHRLQTYSRWASVVPASFRFAVKVPKSITHERRLQDAGELLDAFLAEVVGLGDKIGPLLVQMPPSLRFEPPVAEAFFLTLRDRYAGQVVCEPRHPSWFTAASDALLVEFNVARVAADPAAVPEAGVPGGWDGLIYYRLHGSPSIYHSAYSSEFLERLSATLQESGAGSMPSWCIFDNTADGAATGNALELKEHLRSW